MLIKSLTDEFLLTLSNERWMTPFGLCYEVSGVKPDIPLAVFTVEDFLHSHIHAVKEIVQMIEK